MHSFFFKKPKQNDSRTQLSPILETTPLKNIEIVPAEVAEENDINFLSSFPTDIRHVILEYLNLRELAVIGLNPIGRPLLLNYVKDAKSLEKMMAVGFAQ